VTVISSSRVDASAFLNAEVAIRISFQP